MPPSRRQYLAGALVPVVSGFLPGCSDGSSTSAGKSPTKSTPEPAALHNALDFSVKIIREQTRNNPARILTSLENQSNYSIAIETGPFPPFSETIAKHSNRSDRIILYPPGAFLVTTDTQVNTDVKKTPPKSPIDGCWKLQANIMNPLEVLKRELTPGESIEREFDVYAYYKNDDCLAPGKYILEDTISAMSINENSVTEKIDLGISIKVADNRVISVTLT